jgi:hypothetical protein
MRVDLLCVGTPIVFDSSADGQALGTAEHLPQRDWKALNL